MNEDIVKLYTNYPEDFILGEHDCFEDEAYEAFKLVENEDKEISFSHIILFKKSL